MEIDLNEIHKVKYLSGIPSDGRAVPLFPFYNEDNSDYQLLVVRDKKIIQLKCFPYQGGLFFPKCKNPEVKTIFNKLLNVNVKHFSFIDANRINNALISGILNYCSFIEKYFIFHKEYRVNKNLAIHNLIETEIEELLVHTRSFYDNTKTC